MTAAEIREARKQLGLTQVALGRLLSRDEFTVRRWETGMSPVDPVVALLLQLAIDLPAVRLRLGLTGRD